MKHVVVLNDETENSVGFVSISFFGEIGLGLTEKEAASQYDQDVAEELAAELNYRIERGRLSIPISSRINLKRHHFSISEASPA